MTNDAFLDFFVMRLDSTAILIVDIHVMLHWRYGISIGDSITIYTIK